MNDRLKLVAITAGVLVILLILSFFIKWQYKILAPCRLVAQREWSLYEIEPGKVVSRLISNNPHQIKIFNLLQFNRQDFIKFNISPQIKPGKFIEYGTVIGRLESSENQIRLNKLLGQLESTKADFQIMLSGRKPEIQEKVEKELEYARAAYNSFKPQLQRKRDLFKQKLISYEELERAETQFRLLELNMAVAEAKLKATRTGERDTILNIRRTEIQAIEQQIETLKLKLAAEQLFCPINGIVLDSYDTNNLCLISSVDTMVAQIPVQENKINFIREGDNVNIKIPALNNKVVTGYVTSIGRNAQIINNRMCFIISCSIINLERTLLPNVTGYAKILCDKITLWQLLARWWQISLGQKTFY